MISATRDHRMASRRRAPAGRPPAVAKLIPAVRPVDGMMQAFILSGYFVVVLFAFIATKFSIGIPLRSLLAIALFVLLAMASPNRAIIVFNRLRQFLYVALLFALLGTATSIYNGDLGTDVLKGIVEIPVQSAIAILLTALVAEYCGSRRVFLVFIAVTALSAIVAALQFYGVDAAWRLRLSLATLQGTGEIDLDSDKLRALGISFSKTILASQLCLALTAYYLCRPRNARSPAQATDVPISRVLIGLSALIFIAITTGNRSPVLGGLLFFIFYLFRSRARLFWLMVPLGLAAGLLFNPVMEALQTSGLRAVQTGDDSSLGRITLIHYGWLLFVHNPFGYGFNFNPTLYWRDYIGSLANDTTPFIIMVFPLHNYVLTMLNIYGVLLLFFAPYTYRLLSRNSETTMLFIPYIINILFHNTGPFYSELFLWFVIGAVPRLGAERSAGWHRTNRTGR